jgi:hypothetical protein
LLLKLSAKPAALWRGITSVSLQAVSVWRWQHEQSIPGRFNLPYPTGAGVLSLWLEATNKNDSGRANLIGAIISLLDGIPELMDSAEDELAGMDLKARDKA